MVKKRSAILFVVLLCTTAVVPKVSEGPKNRAVQDKSIDAKDVKTDLERMHVLLAQMQKNAAFVSRGDTPLKHQFELEIEMWQLLLQDMEKKLNAPDSR